MNKNNDQKLNTFIAKLKQNGLLTASHFYVIIPGFAVAERGDSQDLLLFCDGASMPGIQIMTTEIRTFGELSTMPHAPLYNPLNLTFLCDSTMNVKVAIEHWLNQVFDTKTRKFNYYENYTKDIEIHLVDKSGKDVHKLTVREAYPISMGEIQLDYSSANNLIKIPVTLVYKWWESEYISGENSNPGSVFNPISLSGGTEKMVPGQAYYGTKSLSPLEYIIPESQGFVNRVTQAGSAISNEMDNYMSFTPNDMFPDQLLEFGNFVQQSFSRAGNNLSIAYDLVQGGVAGLNIPEIQLYAKTLTKDMMDFGSGIAQLSGGFEHFEIPRNIIGAAVSSLGGTLNGLDGALLPYGLENLPFSDTANRFLQIGNNISNSPNLKSMAGGLSSAGANMLSTGSIFNEISSELRGSEGMSSLINRSMEEMSRTFITNGSNTMNAANVISMLGETGE